MINIEKEIHALRKEKNAILLAHNYQPGEIQDIADHVGDSLYLSQVAASTDAEIIVFCGVHFMAETAKILSPDKKVLLPVQSAGCPMADMITGARLRIMKEKLPDVPVVCYVNSSAEVKAESTICCTSSNAVKVVNSIPEKKILFVPDRNLGAYVAAQISEKEIVLWEGFCPVHDHITLDMLENARIIHPDALILVHPECPQVVIAEADFAGSTSQILDYVKRSPYEQFIIGTENGILHTLNKENPHKKFYPLSPSMFCMDMKKISLLDVARALREETVSIEVPESVRQPASIALHRMLAISLGGVTQL